MKTIKFEKGLAGGFTYTSTESEAAGEYVRLEDVQPLIDALKRISEADMTIEDRARKLCKEMEWPILRDDRLKTILAALREQDIESRMLQDRDTRHACAEAVDALSSSIQIGSVDEILNRAASACMNVKTK